jgi:hypothetical protein
MERRDLYQDDLTEERMPSPAQRDDVQATERLDPDVSQDDGPGPMPAAAIAKGDTLGYPDGVPGGVRNPNEEEPS